MSETDPIDVYGVPSNPQALATFGMVAIAGYLTHPHLSFDDCAAIALAGLREDGRIKGRLDEHRFVFHFRRLLGTNAEYRDLIEREAKALFTSRMGYEIKPADYLRRMKMALREMNEHGFPSIGVPPA